MAIEAINPITVTAAQAKAIRKMAIANAGVSNNQMAALVFGRAVKNAFTPMAKSVGEKAGKLYDMAEAGGFKPDLPRDEYVKRALAEYRDILSDLNGGI